MSSARVTCDNSATAPAASALCDWGSHLRLWSITIVGLALDLWSKQWAFQTLRQGGKQPLIPHVLSFETALNSGALFGIGSGQTAFFIGASMLALGLVLWMFIQNPPHRRLLQIALGGILAGALGNMYDRITVRLISPGQFGLRTDQGRVGRYCQLIEADAERISVKEYPPAPDERLYTLSGDDRAAAERPAGYVRDFIKINTTFRGKQLWPWVFNVADMLLVVGVSILAIHLWTDRRQPDHAASGSSEDADEPAAQD